MSRPYYALGAAFLLFGAASAQETDYSKVQIKTTAVGEHLYVLAGAGGNIAVVPSSQGTLLVDDEFAALADKVRAAVKALPAAGPIRFVVNTHYHFDHTDANPAFAQEGAVLIAQDNVRRRLESGGTAGNGGTITHEMKPAPPGGLPQITFSEELTVHLPGEDVRVHHYAHAHTDGDSIVFFPAAHAVHMGDIFVRYGFPFIDINAGGSVRGMIAACEDVIARLPPDARVIPGHGEVASVADLREYTQMLKDTAAKVAKAMSAGETLPQMEKEKLLGPWSERYSPAGAFVTTDTFTESLYNSLAMVRVRHGPAPRPH